ncbi:MAG: Integral membrane protein YggT, involved in response to extracytoplasmic stress (osmotic shock) [uncultured Thiotrichaceae bacterium]|uniref:Integral membrane protein YggT, involved in response to extracytoplasmic stress (Osmotic shock) n=1 Tax=uncultured Thiotrichaceae bacterium TaxID=298394 RepID=A0A6S6TF38_9GAMM|nr:MAG: Integral membrane protein YggT, involved in response to extracytoplasmic stress (osmotic shock) [uncultured Thiotrichaceae bacterium]
MGALQDVLVFLVSTLFNLYITLLLVRMMLGLSKADFYNPISQFIIKITNPVIIPLRRFIPSVGKVDTSAVVASLGLKALEVFLMSLIAGASFMDQNLVKLILGDLLRMIVWIYIIALIIQAIISWVGSAHGNPIVPILNSLTDPLLRPVRRVIPPVAMVDLSPLVVILGLQIVLILLNGFGL